MASTAEIIDMGQSRALQALSEVFVDFAEAKDVSLPERVARLTSVGWREVPSEPVARMARRVEFNDVGGRVGLLTRARYRDIRAFLKPGTDHLMRKVPWVPPEVDQHGTAMLRHPKAEGWIVSLVGLRGGDTYPPRQTISALHVFGPIPTKSVPPLVDAFRLAPQFDGTGPRFMTPSGNRRRSGTHAWRHDLGEFDCFARGHLSSGGRDRFDLVFAMRTFFGALLPRLGLPSTCILYSIGTSQLLL